MKVKQFLTVLIILIGSLRVSAQLENPSIATVEIKNINHLLDDEKLVIYYDLLDDESNRVFDLDVVIYNDGKTFSPKKGITGHLKTKEGRRKITWWYPAEGLKKSDFKKESWDIQITSIHVADDIFETKSSLNLGSQPSLAPLNLKKRQSEFNFLFTRGKDNEAFDFDPDNDHFRNVKLGDSIPNFNSINLTYMRGLSSSGWLSAGLIYRYSFIDNKFVQDNQENIIDTIQAQSSFGPSIRWRPFGLIGKNTDLILTNSVLFRDNGRLSKSLSATRYSFENQITLTQYIRPLKLILLASADVNVLPKSTRGEISKAKESKHPIYFSYNALVGFYPKRNFLFFSSLNYSNEYGNVPWAESDDSTRYRRNLSTNLNIGGQWTIYNTYSIYGGYSFELENKFGGQAPFGYLGLRFLIKG